MANEKRETATLLNTGIQGEVKIEDDVVAVIAALAAQEVDGVGTMHGGVGKNIMAYVGVKKADKGVRVEVVNGVVRADVAVHIRYGYSIPEVSKKVQEKVRSSIETMTGLTVADVNIRVAGIQMEAGTTA